MEILIGQDIRKYKTKDIGNFSFKEAAFLAAGAAVGFLTYKLTGSIEIAIPPAGLILFFGSGVLISILLSSYKSEFVWDTLSSLMAFIQFLWRFLSPLQTDGLKQHSPRIPRH